MPRRSSAGPPEVEKPRQCCYLTSKPGAGASRRASGRSSRQVAAISEKLVERLKEDFGILCKVEGKETGDWVLIDAGDVIVHVFRPEVRDFYQLEKMWLPAGARMPVRA